MFSNTGFKWGFGWICFIVGVIGYVISYVFLDESDFWYDILIKIGDVLIIGVVVGYLTNAAQFLGIFKKELQAIIYGEEFLKVRNDISPLWETVTKEMFESKFPAINKALLTNIKHTYLPTNNRIYYNDYNTTVNVEWVDKARNIIKVKHDISFELIADCTDKIKFPLKSWIDVVGLNKGDYSVTVSNYMVNDKPAKILKTIDREEKGQHYFEQIIELKDCDKYDISKEMVKKYSLEKDFTIGFRASYLINKLTINFKCPDDLNFLFYSLGTIDDFKTLSDSKTGFTKQYRGLLFKNQGYIIALNKQ
jgi:hypothetical protein